MNSLKARLFLSTLIMTVVMLPIIGFTLTQAFEKQLMLAVQSELKAYSYSIFTVAEVENNQLLMPELLLETQFNVSQSGLYALITALPKGDKPATQIKQNDQLLWQSQSLLTLPLPKKLPFPQVGQTQFSSIILAGNPHLLYSYSVSFSDNGQSFAVTLHLIKNQQDFAMVLHDFKRQLWTWLFALMVVFICVQIIWLLWTLKPLNMLTHELAQIEKGDKKALNAVYPSELQPVTQQLNNLLVTEENQRTRYRNALADLAHSLKNPLAVVMGCADLMSRIDEVRGHPHLHECVDSIQHASKEMMNLVTSMLDLVKMQSTLTLNLQPVDLRDFVGDLVAKARIKATKRNIDLKFTTQEAPVPVRVDSHLMRRVMDNLISNAIKYSPDDSIIEVMTMQEGQKVVIHITDEGFGVDSEHLKHIFDPFFRAKKYDGDREIEGTGLGLSIVKELVDQHNGQINVVSELGQGTTFSIYLHADI